MQLQNNNKLFLISDTHFYHTNIIKYCNRPFADANEMNERLIDNWNSVVDKNDTVLHLGDVTAGVGNLKNKKSVEIMERLNGNKIFLRGNHDSSIVSLHMLDSLTFEWKGIKIYCSHIPNPKFQKFGTFHLHGHIHNNTIDVKNAFNCSVENINYTPIRLSEVIEKHVY
jgi:calcineurin-like phosphoesterase family protein